MKFVQVTEELLRKLADLVGNQSERAAVHGLVDKLPVTSDSPEPPKEDASSGQ